MAKKFKRGVEVDQLAKTVFSAPGKVEQSWINPDLPQFVSDKFEYCVIEKIAATDEFKS